MILLDTHVVIWLLLDPDKLSEAARQKIDEAVAQGDVLGCSVLSLYEIVYAMRRGRLRLLTSLDEFLRVVQQRLSVLPVSASTAMIGGQLRDAMHGDAMDRMIEATAIERKCALLTADEHIRQAQVCTTVW